MSDGTTLESNKAGWDAAKTHADSAHAPSNAEKNSVTGVKGNAESAYRIGEINLTPADIGAFPNMISVSKANTNLDDYKTSGIYFFNSTYIPANIPSGVNGWLVVTGSGDAFVKQLWFHPGTANSNDCEIFVRMFHGDLWSDWKQFAVTDDVDQKVSKSGDTMTDNLRFSNGKVQIQFAPTSNSKIGIEWMNGTDGWENCKYQPGISQHNTGGDGTGSMTLCPYPTNEYLHGGKVGLFIYKGEARIDGKRILIIDDASLPYPAYRTIKDGTDLDTVIQPGIYQLTSNMTGTLTNFPFGAVTTILRVTVAGTYILQECFTKTQSKTRFKIHTGNNEWNAWY